MHVFMPQKSNLNSRTLRALAALGDDSGDANGNGVPDDLERPSLDPALAAGANAVMSAVVASLRAAIAFTSTAAKTSQYLAIAPPAPTFMQSLLGPVYEAAGLVAGAVNFADGALANRRDAYLSALNTMTTITNRLDSADRADVISQQLPLRKWLDAALIVQEGIYGIVKDIGADLTTPTNLWNDIQTGYEFIKEKAGELPDPTNPWTWLKWAIPLGIMGAVTIGLLFGPEIVAAKGAVRAAANTVKVTAQAAAEAARKGSQINGLYEDRETRRRKRLARRRARR
jgi:hypothetical protein